MATYITVNLGSASKKYAIYEEAEGRMVQLLYVHFELEGDGYICTAEKDGAREGIEERQEQGPEQRTVSAEEYTEAFRYLLAHAVEWGVPGEKMAEVTAIGVRVVAPGSYFQTDRAIDSEYLARLAEAAAIAPLHLGELLYELDRIAAALPHVPLFGISDSAFHATMPEHARTYGIPYHDAARYDIHRFGYHGLSVGSLARHLKDEGALPARAIVCHLGSGASVTALANGRSVDTSMGFTPDEGLLMGTRVGAIDAGAVLHLAKRLGGVEKTIEYLNHASGLLGVSGISADIRVLLARAGEGDARARAALDLYVYGIQKQIGAFAAALGGLDTLVFTGTVGERSYPIRAAVCAGLGYFGVVLDPEKNAATTGTDTLIQAPASGVNVLVFHSREMEELAQATAHMSRDI